MKDHVYYIEITQGADYEDPVDSSDDGFGFRLSVLTDASVRQIDFQSPAGHLFVIPDEEETDDPATGTSTYREYNDDQGAWEWAHERELSNVSGLAEYGDGTYLITITYYAGGFDQTHIWFGMPGSDQPIPQPVQVPRLLSPAPYSGTNSPVTFSWELITDQNANAIWASLDNEQTGEYFDVGVPLSPNQTSWGPIALNDGVWELELVFAHGSPDLSNEDGIEYLVVKYNEVDCLFTVGRPWVDYEVWGGNTDYTQMPDEWWEYYRNPEWTDFVQLTESQDQAGRYCGQYQYYLVRAYRPLLLDAVRASDSTYQSNWPWHWHGWGYNFENLNGLPDGMYATVGDWILFENPGHWQCITLITDQSCPTADLTGDCFVDLADLAQLAQQWLTGLEK
ncbi:MAG: hypothetical protein JW828_06430 [Sedimentisphaerales bacterium]|nr:hypothetical protein [Sedimentisphaerales bacterium]